jgi:RNA polymerase sigma factor (sigma-70 family)
MTLQEALSDPKQHQQVRRVIARIVKDPSHADDVVQIVFEKAMIFASSFRGESHPGTWLHRVAVNAALTIKRKKHLQTEQLDESLFSSDDLIVTLDHRERLCHLSSLAKDLRPGDFYLLRSHVHGEKLSALSAELGMPEAAIKTRIHRVRMKLLEQEQ